MEQTPRRTAWRSMLRSSVDDRGDGGHLRCRADSTAVLTRLRLNTCAVRTPVVEVDEPVRQPGSLMARGLNRRDRAAAGGGTIAPAGGADPCSRSADRRTIPRRPALPALREQGMPAGGGDEAFSGLVAQRSRIAEGGVRRSRRGGGISRSSLAAWRVQPRQPFHSRSGCWW